jgi:hypothetical protein
MLRRRFVTFVILDVEGADDAGISNTGSKVILSNDVVQLPISTELAYLDSVVLEGKVSREWGTMGSGSG